MAIADVQLRVRLLFNIYKFTQHTTFLHNSTFTMIYNLAVVASVKIASFA